MWLSTLEAVLDSPEGEQARSVRQVSVGTVMMVARDEAAHADFRTGRGLRTCHASVASRLGMSKRSVQNARWVLLQLGFEVEISRGKKLPKDSVGLASERALSLPQRFASVDTCHLTGLKKVSKRSPVPKTGTKAAQARPKAASRPAKRRERTSGAGRGRLTPQRQRFAWLIAELCGLLRPDVRATMRDPRRLAQIPGGSLRGNRHIGALHAILERFDVTPERYTVDTFRIELNEALAAADVRTMSFSDTANPLGYFAWMMTLLTAARAEEGTLLERRTREHQERLTRRQEAARKAQQDRQDAEALKESTAAAAAAFFAQARRTPARTHRATNSRDLVRAILGGHSPDLHHLPRETQITVGHLLDLDRSLTSDGWSAELADQRITWHSPNHTTLTLHITTGTTIDVAVDEDPAELAPHHRTHLAAAL